MNDRTNNANKTIENRSRGLGVTQVDVDGNDFVGCNSEVDVDFRRGRGCRAEETEREESEYREGERPHDE